MKGSSISTDHYEAYLKSLQWSTNAVQWLRNSQTQPTQLVFHIFIANEVGHCSVGDPAPEFTAADSNAGSGYYDLEKACKIIGPDNQEVRIDVRTNITDGHPQYFAYADIWQQSNQTDRMMAIFSN